jgi:hypothetical protein
MNAYDLYFIFVVIDDGSDNGNINYGSPWDGGYKPIVTPEEKAEIDALFGI